MLSMHKVVEGNENVRSFSGGEEGVRVLPAASKSRAEQLTFGSANHLTKLQADAVLLGSVLLGKWRAPNEKTLTNGLRWQGVDKTNHSKVPSPPFSTAVVWCPNRQEHLFASEL